MNRLRWVIIRIQDRQFYSYTWLINKSASEAEDIVQEGIKVDSDR